MKFRPLKNRILVKYGEDPEVSRGGVLLINPDPNAPVEGTVIACGDLENIQVQPGDKVLMKRAAGLEVTIADEKFHVVSDDLVLGVRNV